MRILVLQLARFGDIYQTWPTLNALRRTYPGAEVHVLVRHRFRQALDNLDFVRVHVLPTAEVLEPIYEDGDEMRALNRLSSILETLAAQKFSRVINLSFSPLSSFVTDYLSDATVSVAGYSRFADGFFNPTDDFSAYFYAQVGVGRANRYHLTDLFAGVAGVELEDADFRALPEPSARRGVVVHLGASQIEKTYAPEKWAEVLTELRKLTAEPVTLIGSAAERALSAAVIARAQIKDVIDRTGETTLPELFDVLNQAKLMIGADSGPVHIAALTATPVCNLSSRAVNFWETGPVSAGSRVLWAEEVDHVEPARVAREAASMLSGSAPVGPCAVRVARAEPFQLHQMSGGDDFRWALIEALYTGTPYPSTEAQLDLLAFQRLHELAELALENLARWDGPGRAAAAQQLSLVDDLLPEIAKMNGRVEPVVQWFQTQRLRVGPGAADAILVRTKTLFEELRTISAVFFTPVETIDGIRQAIALGADIAPALREYDFANVETRFHELIAVLHELAARSTNVGPETAAGWSTLVSSLGEALAARDFIELADRLEFELPRELQSLVPDVLV